MTNLLNKISKKRDEINRHYWRFTRQAKGNPPPAHLYKELSELEDKLKKEKNKKAKASPKGDTTQKRRQSKRTAQLNAIAQAAGWKGISEYLTAIINGQVRIVVKSHDSAT